MSVGSRCGTYKKNRFAKDAYLTLEVSFNIELGLWHDTPEKVLLLRVRMLRVPRSWYMVADTVCDNFCNDCLACLRDTTRSNES